LALENKDVSSLIQQLLGDDDWLAIDAAQTLGEIGDKTAVSALLEVLVGKGKEKYDEIIQQANQTWEKGDKHGAIAITEHLAGDVSQLRLEAARALGKIGHKAVIPELMKVAHSDKDLWVRSGTVWSLGELIANEAIPVLEEILQTITEPHLPSQISLYNEIVGALEKIDSSRVP
jgi:HEAT repeat protein